MSQSVPIGARDCQAVNAHRDTPTLTVVDPRSRPIRSVGYCRLADGEDIESRVTRQVFDEVGRTVATWDPRLFGTSTKANQATVFGLSGQPVLTESVDAGWQLKLMNHAGTLHSVWDGRGNQTRFEYDDQQRPLTVIEQMRVVDRFSYGDGAATRNQCGRLIRHDDPAGSGIIDEYGLLGTALVESRRFLNELETPDWPLDLEEREQRLEEQSYVTRHAFLPTGDVEHQTDAMGNVRSFVFGVAGMRRESWLLLAGKQPQCLISDVHHNALGQVESETAGNGVRTQCFYGDDDGRLRRSVASVSGQNSLQDLNYTYDPAGNITELEDKAQSVTWFNNQRVEPIIRYRYDSLYQLIEASGWEVVTPSHGPALPALLPIPLDPNQRRNYTQGFDYDKAGNLINRHHSNVPGLTMFTSAHSNRSLPRREDGSLPGEPDIDAGFDAAGNQLALQRGQVMTWDTRNQLSRVTLVSRHDDPGDDERYAYDRPGHRVRKVSVSHNSRRALQVEVRYLPNLEIRRQADGEEHHVISIEAGRSSVRALHWPQGVYADQLRYILSDHLGSSTLELDQDADVLTQEHYYPFGGTACWAGKSEWVAKYKNLRYSCRERDATGLYHYGHRYLAPWLQRWISPDPAGQVDGPNLYAMVRNNPINFYDRQGTLSFPVDIFIADIVNPMNKTIGTGWFEELTWNQEQSAFMSTGPVYGRGMNVIEGENSEWYPSSSGQAITLFRDQQGKLRLFANMYFQHLGMQPQMGLPVFAGILKVDEHDAGKFIFDNHSGHYKPDSTIHVEGLIRELGPPQNAVSYAPIPQGAAFDSTLRINAIGSPESYERLVNMYKKDFNGLISYLKKQGVWEAAKERWGESAGMNIIFRMEATGMTAQQIYNEDLARSHAPAATAQPAPRPAQDWAAAPPHRERPKKSFFKSLFARR